MTHDHWATPVQTLEIFKSFDLAETEDRLQKIISGHMNTTSSHEVDSLLEMALLYLLDDVAQHII